MPASPAVMARSAETDAQLLLALQPSEAGTILVVEDDDQIARLILLILSRTKRRVVHARDCASAVVLFAEHRSSIDMLIVDATLPDGDGLRLCEDLRAMRPRLPVLMTSGKEPARTTALNKGGITAFLPKPFLPMDVERTVSGVLRAIA